MQEASLACNNTEAKQAKAVMKILSDGKRLATITGLAFLLNEYAVCSVESQHARAFPTSTMVAIMKLEDKLERLSKGWEWSTEEMKLAGFGSPSDIIKDLLAGTYQPRIKPGSIKRSSILHNIWRKDYFKTK